MTAAAIRNAVTALVAALAVPAHAGELHRAIDAGQVVDLTHELHAEIPVWPGDPPFQKTPVRGEQVTPGEPGHRYTMSEGIGTHADAPAHVVPGGRTLDQLPANDLILPAVVIDVTDEAAGNADYRLTRERVRAWEKNHGRIPANALVILATGWHAKFDSQDAYANADADGTLHFPGFGAGAAKLLLDRGIRAVATDTLSIDAGAADGLPVHELLLGEGVWALENLANLDRLPPRGATVIAAVLPVRGGTQAQARVVALLP